MTLSFAKEEKSRQPASQPTCVCTAYEIMEFPIRKAVLSEAPFTDDFSAVWQCLTDLIEDSCGMLRWRLPPLRVCLLRYHRGANNARSLLRLYYHAIVNVNERRYYADANCALSWPCLGRMRGINQRERDISGSQRGWNSRFISLINKRAVLKSSYESRFTVESRALQACVPRWKIYRNRQAIDKSNI